MQHKQNTFAVKAKSLFRFSLLSSAMLFALNSASLAAVVPQGVTLADKQEINLQNVSEIVTLDPQKIDGTADAQAARQLLEGLVNTDELDHPIPGVAERWEHSPDNKQWTFYLRHNAKWSNGDPVTAHDFVYAWQRLIDPKTASTYAYYLSFLKVKNVDEILEGKQSPDTLGVKALDDYTFQIELSDSVPFVADVVANAALYPVHRATVEKYGDDWVRPEHFVGNGAYLLGERVLNEKIEFIRNPNYWNDKETVINKAIYHVVPESAGIARYRSGALDIAYIPLPTYKDQKFRKEYQDQIFNVPKLTTFFFVFNLDKAPFTDIRVRKALDLSIDRSIIVDKVLGFGQKPTYTITPSYVIGGEKIQQPEYANWTQQQRNEEAKKLLLEAGYSKSNPLKTTLLYNTNEGIKSIAVAATSMWKKNLDGLADIQLTNMEWKTFLSTKQQGNFNLAVTGWVADYNEATTFLSSFISNSGQNDGKFKDEEFDRLLNLSYKAKDENERAEIYAKAEAELDKHHPFVSLYNGAGLIVKNPKLKGYESKSPQGIFFIKDLYLEK